jgi:extracellular solute-binding protein family 5
MIFAIVKIKSEDQKKESQIYETKKETEEEVKEIKLGIASFDSINPILSKNKNVQDISKLIFEPLMTLTSDYKLETCLAKEWAKQNETTYIIKLKDDRKWSDGNKFTAEDVRYTIDRLKDSDTIYASNVKDVTTVEVVDDTTIRIILSQEVPFFEYNLTFPILSSKYYSDKEFNADIVPIGTGMYKVSEVQDTALILSKNEYYPESNNLKLDKITVTTYSSVGELYNSFKTGSIDLISTQNSNLKEYIGTIGYLSKEMKGREHDFIAFNTQSQILSQVNVRKAICYSIDKNNIVSSVFGDNYYTSSFPLDYGTWIYNEQEASSGYNLEQAKQILTDNGWTYKYKNWQKTENYKTQRISLNFVVKASDENRVKVADNIKQQLENQGFRINLIKANDAQYQSYLTNKNYDMILCSINLSVSPDLSTFFGSNNLANYSNEEVTSIMNEVKNSNDEEKLKQNYKRLGEIYKTEMPYLSLYNNKYIVAYSQTLAGTLEPNWFYQFYNIKDWHK